MANTVLVNPSSRRSHDKGEIREFSAFPFLLRLMFDQTLSNLIVCLMISQEIGRIDFSPNYFQLISIETGEKNRTFNILMYSSL